MSAATETSSAATPRWQRIRMIENPLLRYGLLALALVYFAWSIGALDINWPAGCHWPPGAN